MVDFRMKKWMVFFLAFMPLAGSNSLAQKIVPWIEWEKSFGGEGSDWLRSLQQTADGGYILGGWSRSPISGNKSSPPFGSGDFWVVKVDAQGNKQWENSFGGQNSDYLYSLQQTSDGGYILGGRSESSISGNKTSPNFGLDNFWVVKVDAQGNKQWENVFGGVNSDYLYSLQQTTEGGYILGGGAYSPISGNKISPKIGGYDFWVVKVNAQGTKQWENSYGGKNYDILYSLQQTSEGGYILGGWSSSFSGNKASPNFGFQDFWVVKVDAQGTQQWENSFGGQNSDYLYSLRQTADGGYLLGGVSKSSISGNKTSPNFGEYDFWVVKVDSQGNKEWENSFGGGQNDELYSLQQTSNGGYILGGRSYSSISGSEIFPRFGGGDFWVVKVDTLGNKEWEQSFGGEKDDELYSLQQTLDGGYILGGRSESFISGNKSSPNFGDDDFWVVKFYPALLKNDDRVFYWGHDENVSLEATDDLNKSWEPFNGVIMPLGGFDAVALDTSKPQMFYRLRGVGPVNESDPPLILSIGTMLTWPTDSNQVLETSTTQVGPWEAFRGIRGTVGESNIAIIPQAQWQNYFRTRTAD